MRVTARRPPRWSKKTGELVRFVAHLCRPSLQSELGNWLENSSRFRSFVTDHQDKVRKKLNTSDEQARQDVRAELRVAYLVLSDRRFQVRFEAYGAGQRGPDLSVTFRENQRFNLEVTRLRATEDADVVPRIANVIAGKLRQLPGDVPNGLVIATNVIPVDEERITEATRLLRTHFASLSARFGSPRSQKFSAEPSLQAHYPRLSGVFVVDEATSTFVANREARHPLGAEIVLGLTTAFATPSQK